MSYTAGDKLAHFGAVGAFCVGCCMHKNGRLKKSYRGMMSTVLFICAPQLLFMVSCF
jgi:hypothetical protein